MNGNPQIDKIKTKGDEYGIDTSSAETGGYLEWFVRE
ncbi:hypothetical protein EV677_2020 [Herminiimonas fonticola]|uniref:Uncharacterized protein n=1 Tax=Herminiimonas fonticola TaxID=303380 RepID=A0A4R6G5X7_9BURK|nr:hypothetical protein Hfont_1763 [Herminiimonas fonticola]TDN89951.1 hypothetical protein EV677_2020 [Herminiimonas fonticola]